MTGPTSSDEQVLFGETVTRADIPSKPDEHVINTPEQPQPYDAREMVDRLLSCDHSQPATELNKELVVQNHYPVDSFPPILKNAICALHEDTQMPIEMIGSTLLAATALALQPLIEVVSPFSTEKTEPCSLFFLTLAISGEGKGPIYDKIMAPFNAFAKEMHTEYEKSQDVYKKDHAVWVSKKRGLNSMLQKASKHGGDCEIEEELFRAHLDKEPEKPKKFEMFNDDNSPVGLIEQLDRYPYAGCFANEAMTFFSGYLKNNQALLNKLWSNEAYPYNRKDRNISLIKCRLTVLLMTQPSEFELYLQKCGSRNILNGFIARFLITNTLSTKTQRKINLNQEKSNEVLSKVFDFFNQCLHKQKEMFYDKSIPVKKLSLTDEAKNLFKNKKEQYITYTAQNQKWEHISEFVSKADSQAIRIAALFSYYSETISESVLNNAFTITEWHLNQAAQYFYESSEQFQLRQDVYDLFETIKKCFAKTGGQLKYSDYHTSQTVFTARRPWQPFLKYEVKQYAPGRLRGVGNKTEAAFEQLIRLGLIVTVRYPPYNEIYVAIPRIDQFGRQYPQFDPEAICELVQCRNNVEKPLDDYDYSRLRWS